MILIYIKIYFQREKKERKNQDILISNSSSD